MQQLRDYEQPIEKGQITALPYPFLYEGKPIHPEKDGIQLVNDWGDWESAPCIIAVYNEFGLIAIVSGDSQNSCWDAWIDEQPTINEDDVPAAYGFDQAKDKWDPKNAGDTNDLDEGYAYQANCTGTGIVNVGHYITIQSIIGD